MHLWEMYVEVCTYKNEMVSHKASDSFWKWRRLKVKPPGKRWENCINEEIMHKVDTFQHIHLGYLNQLQRCVYAQNGRKINQVIRRNHNHFSWEKKMHNKLTKKRQLFRQSAEILCDIFLRKFSFPSGRR